MSAAPQERSSGAERHGCGAVDLLHGEGRGCETCPVLPISELTETGGKKRSHHDKGSLFGDP